MLEWLKNSNEHLSACIIGEPTSAEKFGDMIKIGRRGSICFKIIVNGVQGHVAYPHFADNPITKLINILHLLKSKKLDDGNEFFQASNLEITNIDVGNNSTNTIPASASANFNIRYNNQYDKDSVIKWVQEICMQITENYKLEIISAFDSFLNKNVELSQIVANSVKQVTGISPELSTTGGTSDARFIKDFCPVIEFGLINKTAHKVNEYTSITEINQLSEIYFKILESYFI
jgi:succinyl-diaminopimelate desuccinylase